MIIHAKLVMPAVQHRCSGCGSVIVGAALRLFGSSGNGERPYRVYSCVPCAKKSRERKIIEALRRGGVEVGTKTIMLDVVVDDGLDTCCGRNCKFLIHFTTNEDPGAYCQLEGTANALMPAYENYENGRTLWQRCSRCLQGDFVYRTSHTVCPGEDLRECGK